MKYRFLLFLSLQSFCLCNPISAQQGATHVELHGESVTRIFKDNRGLMWMGTSNGLICYDELGTLRFTTPDCSRPNNFVNDICQLPDGTIVVGMRNGLYRVDFPSRSCQRIYPSLTEVSSLLIVQSRAGEQLAVGCRQGLAMIDVSLADDPTMVLADRSNVTSDNNQVTALTSHAQHPDVLWFTNARGTLFSYQMGRQGLRHYAVPDSLLSSSIQDIQLVHHTLYLGTTNSGLLQFDTQTQQFSREPNSWSSIRELSLYGDTLYVCTDGGGAYTLHQGSIRPLQPRTNSVYSCYHDAQLGIYWYGYYQEGFSYSQQRTPLFSIYRFGDFTTEGLFVRSFCRRQGQVLIGTRDGFYFIDEHRNIVRHFTPQEIGGAIITDVRYFAGRYVIANYERGLFSFDPATLQLQPLALPSLYRERSCSRLVPSADGEHLYAGTRGCLLILDRNLRLVQAYDDAHSTILSSYIYDMALDPSGKLWISSVDGVCLFDPRNGRFQSDGFPAGFFNTEGNIAFNLTHDGNLMAASEKSLFYCASNLSQCREYNLISQLGLGYINFVQPLRLAGTSRYLLGTDRGLFLYDETLSQFQHFSQQSGLPSLRFPHSSCQIDDEGTLWMANARGLVYLPRERREALTAPVTGRLYMGRYRVNNDEHIINPFDRQPDHISVNWNFGADLITLYPTQLDYNPSHTDGYYIWSLDGGNPCICYDESPLTLRGLSLGRHTVSMMLPGHPETTLTVTLSVWPSWRFYLGVMALVLLLIVWWMMHCLRQRRRAYYRLVRQHHRLQLDIAASHAVESLQRQQQEQLRRTAEEKQRSKEDALRYHSQNYRELRRKVRHYMESEQPYLRSNLRLSEVAAHVGTNAATLSQMFNDYMQTNYFDFVNAYRIEHFKQLALDPQYTNYTVLAISEMCGFKRSSFFNVFKKMEGCTPSEWVRDARG